MAALRTICVLASVGLTFACDRSRPTEKPAPVSAPAAEPERIDLLREGARAPDIQATAHNGQLVNLHDFRGKPVVVYFYPKDDTPGCTTEAQEIRDLWADLEKTRAVVLGVSADDNVSHSAFASKYELPFLLLPDTEHEIARAFGVPIKNGRAKRVTFVIGPDGTVRKVFPDVTPKGHGTELLQAVKALAS